MFVFFFLKNFDSGGCPQKKNSGGEKVISRLKEGVGHIMKSVITLKLKFSTLGSWNFLKKQIEDPGCLLLSLGVADRGGIFGFQKKAVGDGIKVNRTLELGGDHLEGGRRGSKMGKTKKPGQADRLQDIGHGPLQLLRAAGLLLDDDRVKVWWQDGFLGVMRVLLLDPPCLLLSLPLDRRREGGGGG